MYYVFTTQLLENKGKIVQAKVLNDTRDYVPNYGNSLLSATPFVKPLQDMSFLVSKVADLPDNLFTGTMLDLFSEKLVCLLTDEGIPNQLFETSLIEEKTNRKISEKYFIFHLLNSYTGIDIEASDIDDLNIRTISMTKECLEAKPLLFRDTHKRHLLFIHSNLKEKLEKNKISGCEYTHYSKYKHIFGSW